MVRVSREQIVGALRRYAGTRRGGLTFTGFLAWSGYSEAVVYRRLGRGWHSMLAGVGLGDRALRAAAASDDELMRALHRVVLKLGRFPRWVDLNEAGTTRAAAYQKRFGRIGSLRTRYEAWLARTGGARAPAQGAGGTPPGKVGPAPGGSGKRAVRGGAEPDFGRPLSIRGVAHEPTNEVGVVHLFGALCESLGFVVTRMGQGFPDCEAMRCVDRTAGRWERVRIEIEHRSSNFLRHGHDARGCDLIVCWEHDWARCPLEVVELRKVFGRVDGERAA